VSEFGAEILYDPSPTLSGLVCAGGPPGIRYQFDLLNSCHRHENPHCPVNAT
jgi:hypothetical protein